MTDVVVVGLGYVGLPLAQAAVAGGLEVLGFDADPGVVQALSAGRSHVDDLSDDDVRTMLEAGFAVSADEEDLHGAAAIVICVPTPLADEGGPDLRAVVTASEMVARHLQPGTLVVLESTTWPGTTEEVVRPVLERTGLRVGRDIHLAFSPERIDPGNPTWGMRNTPKVVGGVTPQCGDAAEAFYSRFIDTVVRAHGTREAEMAKLLENTYRQVNIALVNEMAKFSHELGIDFWDVIRCASTKPFGFQPFSPGPGVGGHCIPIDPSYLSHRVQAQLGYPFRFVELAQEVNRSMPRYVAERAWRLLNREGKAVQGSRVLLLGITYKPGIADQRESPAIPLAHLLEQMGAELAFYDPFIQRWETNGRWLDRVGDLRAALRDADLVIHLQPHPDYDETVLADIETPVLDTRGRFGLDHVERL
jgi:nucleotide sugar dehydrogenase